MPLFVLFIVVHKTRAPMPKSTIVHDLYLTWLEEKLAYELWLTHDGLERFQGVLAYRIKLHTSHLVAVNHMAMRQAAQHTAVIHLHHRMTDHWRRVRRMLFLAVKQVRSEQTVDQIRTSFKHFIEYGIKAHDTAYTAFFGSLQAQQGYIVRRTNVIAVVRMKILLGIRDIGAYAIARRLAKVAHIINDLAVPALRSGP